MGYKLGSLFDGSGGFPLAGGLCGVEPCWASEVEPYPIAVTRERFPNVKHLGDISKIHGGEIEPVDIITFGSPCQDLSVAGKRAGLKHEANGDEETTRSGLFMEAVRIIKEMRRATNGQYPRFALWENVPGAFSSNKGEDFRIVCEELIKIVEPRASMPEVPKNGWAYADSYIGDGWSLAYRVFDAQYWGVPQRRRRIHLVADFRGECAREVLFEREGVRGYFAQGRTPWQAAPADAQGCTGADDREGEGFDRYNGDLTGEVSATLGVNCGVSTGRNGVIERDGGLDAVAYTPILDSIGGQAERGWMGKVAPTLKATHYKFAPCVVAPVPYTLKERAGCAGGGKGPLDQEDKSATLATSNDQYLFQPTDSCILDDQGGQQINVRTDGKAPTLRAETHGNLPCVIEPQGFDGYNQALTGDKSKSLSASATDSDHVPGVVYSIENHPADSRVNIDESGKVQTLTSRMGTGGGNVPMVMEPAPVIALDRASFNQGQNAKYDFEVTDSGVNSTIVARGPGAVAYPAELHDFIADHNADVPHQQDQLQAADGVARPLVAATHGAASHHTKTVIYDHPHYIVRRLTPTECARLQGFADCWGHVEKKDSLTDEEYRFWLEVRNTHTALNGKKVQDYTEKQMLTWYNKLWTDSAEYKMWGNGIALPPALYCLQGIVDVLSKPEEDPDDWMS